MKITVWKDVVGYEGSYQVSVFGQVRSLERYVRQRRGSLYHVRPRILKSTLVGRYPTVVLCIDRKAKIFSVHCLVAFAFLGPKPTSNHEVDHIDGVKTNNCVSNLEWVTRLENHQRACALGLCLRSSRGRYRRKKKQRLAL